MSKLKPIPKKMWRSRVASIDLPSVIRVRLYGENLSRPELSGLNGSQFLTSPAEISVLYDALLTSERLYGGEPIEEMSYGDYVSFEFPEGQYSVRFGFNRDSLSSDHGQGIEAALNLYWTTEPISVPPNVTKELDDEIKRLSVIIRELEARNRRP